MMLQYAVVASLIQFALHLVQILILQLTKTPYTITEPIPYFMIGVIQEVAALSPTLRHT